MDSTTLGILLIIIGIVSFIYTLPKDSGED